MKKFRLFLFGIIFLCQAQNSFSAFVYETPQNNVKPKHVHEISPQQHAAIEEFLKLTPEQYGKIRGKKLSFFEKIEFGLLHKKLKKRFEDGSSGFNIGGFLLGFFLGLLGVLLAYIFSKDRNFRRWTWYGFLIYVAIILVIIAAAGGS